MLVFWSINPFAPFVEDNGKTNTEQDVKSMTRRSPLRCLGETSEHAAEFSDGERLGEADFAMLFQERFSLLIDDIAGHENKTARGAGIFIPNTFEKALPIQSRHFPVA